MIRNWHASSICNPIPHEVDSETDEYDTRENTDCRHPNSCLFARHRKGKFTFPIRPAIETEVVCFLVRTHSQNISGDTKYRRPKRRKYGLADFAVYDCPIAALKSIGIEFQQAASRCDPFRSGPQLVAICDHSLRNATM